MLKLRLLVVVVFAFGLAACTGIPPSDGQYSNSDSDSGSDYSY